MSSEINLEDVLKRIEASGLKDRELAFTQLRRSLRNSTQLNNLSDSWIRRLYEVLFAVALSEQSVYLKAKTTSTRSAADGRLSSCAASLRLAVEATVKVVTLKTIKSVLHHVVQTFFLPSERFCEPLALEYAKCLKVVLEFQPHVEHLNQKDREQIADFCIKGIQVAESEAAGGDAPAGSERPSATFNADVPSYRSSNSHFKESNGSQSTQHSARLIAQEMVACLSVLTTAPNAISGGKSKIVLSALVQFLQNSSLVGGLHREAFAAIINILASIRTDNIALTKDITITLVRLIRRYWSLQSSPGLLVIWLYLRPYLLSIFRLDRGVALRTELIGALETMQEEYLKRHERDQLRLDDLALLFQRPLTKRAGEIGTSIFQLRCTGSRGENSWTLLYIIASLHNMLNDEKLGEHSQSDDDGDLAHVRSRKRQRLNKDFDELLTTSIRAPHPSRICALQSLTFLAQQRHLFPGQLRMVADKLLASCHDDNASVVSWAFLALTSLASQSTSSDGSLSECWTTVWSLAFRAMVNTQTCRAACHLLHSLLSLNLISQSSAVEIIQAMSTSIDISGPSMVADSVAHLLGYITHLSLRFNPTLASSTADSILNMFFRHFTPSKFDDKVYAAQHHVLSGPDILELVACCLLKEPPRLLHSPFNVRDTVGQAWITCSDQEELIEYLLLQPKKSPICHPDIGIFQADKSISAQGRASSEAIVLNHFTSELYRTEGKWQTLVQEHPRNVSVDTFAFLCNACAVTTHIVHSFAFRDQRRQKQLQDTANRLLKSISEYISSTNCEQYKIDTMLSIFSIYFVHKSSIESQSGSSEAETSLCRVISCGLAARTRSRDIGDFHDDEDMMNTDDGYDSQDSRMGDQTAGAYAFRSSCSTAFHVWTLRSFTSTYAAIISIKGDNEIGSNSSDAYSTRIVDYLVSLEDTSVVLSSGVISSLPELDVELSLNDSFRLLEHCSHVVLRSYAFARSEPALEAILRVMSSLANAWTNQNDTDLFELGSDLYAWFTGVALSGGVLSSTVQKSLATLLLQLCHIDTDYGRNDSNPSVRTSLFKLVELGSISVQFFLAGRISTIFGLFVLSAHSHMFDDLQQSLPTELEWVEGMAMRLLFFAKLASAWHSLLRQCVYYIFETAGKVTTSSRYASRCVVELTMKLGFDSPRRLFRLFAPQLLHTWLESYSISTLPFASFDYDSIESLFTHNLSEVMAQLLMRGREEDMHIVASSLKTRSEEIIKRTFSKCLAYCISRDITRPTTGAAETSESLLRKLVGGKDKLSDLAREQFPAIVGHFLLSMQQDDIQEKWLERHPEYSSVTKALAEINSFSCSTKLLPPTQQPSFKSKYLWDQIARLCRRTSHNPANPWDMSSFCLVVRMILDSIDQALGPLHTCLLVRRLRLLICMAGEVACQGFAIEMLIHSLRPFLNDSQCSDDTVGILQYLFNYGKPYLQKNLSFAYGAITLIILQMCKHSIVEHDSTTQENEHQATVRKMQSFRIWLVKYLRSCRPSEGSVESNTFFLLSESLPNVQLPGNARRDTPESLLLLALLQQEECGQEMLLLPADRDEALRLLTENFEFPSSVADDCLGDDEKCDLLAPKLWHLMRSDVFDGAFVSWAANKIGRAYLITGIRPKHNKLNSLAHRNSRASGFEGFVKSQASIALRLSKSLFSRNRIEATLADHTLRKVALSFRSEDEAVAFEQNIPDHAVPAIVEGTFGYNPACVADSDAIALPSLEAALDLRTTISVAEWIQQLSLALCASASEVEILPALIPILANFRDVAADILPSILHILLERDIQKDSVLRGKISKSFTLIMENDDDTFCSRQQCVLQILMYLRTQPFPGENTIGDRLLWLDIDLITASKASTRCNLPSSALLLAESIMTPTQKSRREASRASLPLASSKLLPQELLLSIFRAMDEPDSFYGIEQPASLDTVLGRLDHEADGLRSLMFRSAQTDVHLRRANRIDWTESTGVVKSMAMLNLNSVSFALLSSGLGDVRESPAELLSAARKLQQWDVVIPDTATHDQIGLFKLFQELNRASDVDFLRLKLRSTSLEHVRSLPKDDQFIPSHTWMSNLASLTEINYTIDQNYEHSLKIDESLFTRSHPWMRTAPFDEFSHILYNRQNLFSVLASNASLRDAMRFDLRGCRKLEVQSLVQLSTISREHDQLQEALSAATQLTELVIECRKCGLHMESIANLETASILWKLHEASASVKMLQDTLNLTESDHEIESIGSSGLLAQIGHQLAEARLEKPEEILSKYLKPAIDGLNGRVKGGEAGQVFHEFASFCDKQLQSPGNLEDFARIATLRQNKLDEVQQLEQMAKKERKSGEHNHLLKKARQWFEIDNADYQRLKDTRETFIQQSLQNYLLALQACDEHNMSVLRFFALWLENADSQSANTVTSKHLTEVPSWKFVLLLNQLMSRLGYDQSVFQNALRSLAFRICADHPYHSLHHLYACTRKPQTKEHGGAASRYQAASEIRQRLMRESADVPTKAELLRSWFVADNMYNVLAWESSDSQKGSKISAKDLQSAYQMTRKIPDLRVPPATISVPLQADGEYKDVPIITRFDPTIRLMSGLSKPKKLTAIASNGQRFSQLFKSGNDDLRQDAIMEQVFEEVSQMLRQHKMTRQRNLQVRTYKVIPLTNKSGIIEFVPNSISLSDFLSPAHTRYYPGDYKPSTAREKIQTVKDHATEVRIKEFRKICDHVHPVLRHFFFEKFADPDEWFEKRTSYTRTTATVSILGHVLGLGDRHCQNIMLDERTGEVIHIDLGVAFEAGRVLPVPELVPFRLTRDIIDGMGVTKTEGVFRRCCEFTLDALREDRDSIMTLLNVLRYDPLYQWTISPVRAKRMQEATETGRAGGEGEVMPGYSKETDAGESDRALSIVEKKLSKTLSTAAMVNELIQLATDERNLATLFSGWAAYF